MGDNAGEAAPQTEEASKQASEPKVQGSKEKTSPDEAPPQPYETTSAPKSPETESAARRHSVTMSEKPETSAAQEPQEGRKPEDEQKSVPSVSKEEIKEVSKEQITQAKKSSEKSIKKESSIPVIEKKESGIISSENLERKGTRGSVTKEEITTRKSRSERLSSKAKNVLGSNISIRRLSTTGEFYDRTKGARYMNSYKLDSDNPFNPEKVVKILESVMIEAFENLTYDPEKCPKQAKWASSAIRARVKELQFDRYKLICLVTIGEKNSQDVLVTLRFLWDVDRDRYATYSIENTYVFGIAQCFGIYYE